ncbi:MAG TPA: excinuclease ABC subunit UvrC, partial [archaeon]|nr:excinuclease ABC subunit UvrC [archaeon]
MINLENIPSSPGCYIYKDNLDNIIYIGKAKNLKKRVSSYFLKKDHDNKTNALVSNISSVDFIVTSNELEALVLENNLIKKYLPKYNVDLKSGQRYAYIQLTKDIFPRLVTIREKPKGKDDNIFGPFVSGQNRIETIRFLNKHFKLRTCKRLPKTACVRYHIGYCSAPCIANISKEEYAKTIEIVKKILSGKSTEYLPDMKKEMDNYSKNQDFEKALVLRDQISAIEYLAEKQNMERLVNYNQDIINYEIRDNKVYVLLFNIDKGLLVNKRSFSFDETLVDISVLDDFLVKYYSNNQKTIPQEIILPEEISQSTKD